MKTKLGAFPLIYPVPIALVGAKVDGKPTYTLVGDCGLMGLRPPLVYVSLHRQHYINRGIIERAAYSINFPDTAMMAQADYCGIVSGHKVDKSTLFETFYGDLEDVPLIVACPVNIECRVVKEFTIEQRQIFVGEVQQTHVRDDLATPADRWPSLADMQQFDPLIYGLGNRYYRIGPAIGVGYQEGKKLKNAAD